MAENLDDGTTNSPISGVELDDDDPNTYSWEFKLIDLVRANPMLWDSREESYLDTERKNSIWKEIVDKLGLTSGEIGHAATQH